MGIRMDVYLRRTGQTLEGWMDVNGVKSADDFLPRCAFVGLSAGPSDLAEAKAIIVRKKALADQLAASKKLLSDAELLQTSDATTSQPEVSRLKKKKQTDPTSDASS